MTPKFKLVEMFFFCHGQDLPVVVARAPTFEGKFRAGEGYSPRLGQLAHVKGTRHRRRQCCTSFELLLAAAARRRLCHDERYYLPGNPTPS